MATAQKDKTETVEPEARIGVLAQMDVEENITIPLRGRGYDEEVVALRRELDLCVENGTARSFRDVAPDDKETFARKIRAAGNIQPKMKVATRYDKHNRKLIWGPESVLSKLASGES